jgi:quercetin dioxygenase-like cupin family protein
MTQHDSTHRLGAHVRITRADEGVPFTPNDDHHGVYPVRLHGGAAGATDRLNAGRSRFTPGARVDRGPVTGETLYVVVSGELTLDVDGPGCSLLRTGDSVYLPKGTMRALCAGPDGATILVIRNP